jgi:hypothetical protein
MNDQMPKHGEMIQASIRCAKCNETVQPNEPHQCKEEKKDENSK